MGASKLVLGDRDTHSLCAGGFQACVFFSFVSSDGLDPPRLNFAHPVSDAISVQLSVETDDPFPISFSFFFDCSTSFLIGSLLLEPRIGYYFSCPSYFLLWNFPGNFRLWASTKLSGGSACNYRGYLVGQLVIWMSFLADGHPGEGFRGVP